MWEAQFGDFINGAQIIIDQYIVAAEDKWDQHNGLVLLLPHGYEGQGPEHSSARIERFLTLAAEDNMQVVQRDHGGAVLPPAAPPGAQRAPHAARRVHPEAGPADEADPVAVDELTTGSFQEVLDDPSVADPAAVRRIVFCSGKVAWDAIAERDRRGAPVAVVRLEQLYPLPTEQMLAIARAATRTPASWSGSRRSPRTWAPGTSSSTARGGSRSRATTCDHVARVESGSPATGSKTVHDQELADLMDEVFAGL